MAANPVITFKTLIGDYKKLQVPSFQRSYTWKDEWWEALWDDIQSIAIGVSGQSVEVDDRHFTGAILLMKDNHQDGTSIVDGQQRVTTLTILSVAIRNICKQLLDNEDYFQDKPRDEREIVLLETMAIPKATNLLSEGSEWRLRLTEYDNTRFISDVLEEFGTELAVNRNSFRGKKALKWYLRALHGALESKETGKQIVGHLIELLVKLEDGIQFTPIVVTDDSEAYEVFESLNSKGEALSAADLLKNRLISRVADNTAHKEKVEGDWSALVKTLQPQNDAHSRFDLVDFIFFYWRGTHEVGTGINKTASKKLYKTIKSALQQNKITALELVAELLTLAPVFHRWTKTDRVFPTCPEGDALHEAMSEINMLGYRACYPLFIYTHNRRPAILPWLARNTANFLFRQITVNQSRSAVAESVFDELAQLIKAGGSKNDDELMKELAAALNNVDGRLDDNSFTSKIKTGQYQDNKVGKYVHSKLLYHHNRGIRITSKIQLEHILPQEPKKHWSSFQLARMISGGVQWFDRSTDDMVAEWDQLIGDFTYRLGNMCLLLDDDNGKAGNNTIAKKLTYYNDSGVITTKELGACIENAGSEWNMDSIEHRCNEISEVALDIWPSAHATPNP